MKGEPDTMKAYERQILNQNMMMEDCGCMCMCMSGMDFLRTRLII